MRMISMPFIIILSISIKQITMSVYLYYYAPYY